MPNLALPAVLALLAAAPPAERPPDSPFVGPIDDRTGQLDAQDKERLSRQIEELAAYRSVAGAVLLVAEDDLEAPCRAAATAWRAGQSGESALVCLSTKSGAVRLDLGDPLRAQLPDPIYQLVLDRSRQRLKDGTAADAVASVLEDLVTPPRVTRIPWRATGPILGLLPFLLGLLVAAGWSRLAGSKLWDSKARWPLAVPLGALSLIGPALVGLTLGDVHPDKPVDFAIVAFFLQLPGVLAFAILRDAREEPQRVRARKRRVVAVVAVLATVPTALATLVSHGGPEKLMVIAVVASFLSPFVAFGITGEMRARNREK